MGKVLAVIIILLFLVPPSAAQPHYMRISKAYFDTLENSEGNQKLTAYIKLLEYIVNNRPDTAVVIAGEAVTLSKNLNNRSAEAYLTLYLGIAHNKIHNSDEALEAVSKSYELFTSLDDSSGICLALIKLGQIRTSLGDLPEAVECYHMAENIAAAVGNKRRYVDAINYLGILNYILDNQEEAASYCSKGLKLSIEAGYEEGQALAYEHLSILAIKKQKYDEAFDLNTKAYRLREAAGDITSMASIHNNFAIIYNRLGDYQKAVDHIEKSIEMRNSYGDKKGLGTVYNTLGNIYKTTNQLDKSLEYLNLAYSIKHESGDIRTFTSILRNLSEVYQKKNDYRNAFKYLNEFKVYNDSLFGENSRRLLSKAKAKQDLYQKEEEIKALQEKSAYQERHQQSLYIIIGLITLLFIILVIAYVMGRRSKKELNKLYNEIVEKNSSLHNLNNELVHLNKDRDKFFSIIAHDLRSPFYPLLGYSDILVNEFDSLSRDELKQYNVHIKDSVHKLYALLDNLLQWLAFNTGRLSYNPVEFDLKKELCKTVELYSNTIQDKELRFIDESEAEIHVYADKSMSGVILRNIISNAVKFSRKGEDIRFRAVQKNGSIEFTVQDSGIGIPHDKLENIFKSAKSTEGTDKEPGTGLGLFLCKEMTELNGGRFSIDSIPDEGTMVKFTLPAVK